MELFQTFTKILLLLCAQSLIARCSDLSSEGGYKLTLGIRNDHSLPQAERARYLLNIKTTMQVFSNRLWLSTDQTFHISELEIIAPSNWDLTGTEFEPSEIAETFGVADTDIRIGEGISRPFVENENICGLPGSHIRLPFGFFENPNSNEFGVLWKSLLVLFAKYRFGVWEEYGYAQDTRYPYASFNELTQNWDLNACSDEELVGNYVSFQNSSVPCSPSSDGCRFLPDRTAGSNTARSSLMMGYNFVETVTHFCDNESHKSTLDNRHNFMCNGKSVMQIIRESPDYLLVTNPRQDSVPAITVTVKQESQKPLFYLLLDQGRSEGSQPLLEMVTSRLTTLLSDASIQDVISTVGTFPNSVDLNQHTKKETEWMTLDKIIPQLETFFTSIIESTNAPVERDFTRAVNDAVRHIKQRNHAHGAILFVVKTGTDVFSLRNVLPETHLISSLNENKILMHSLEIVSNPEDRAYLGPAASSSGGLFTSFYNPDEVDTTFSYFGDFVRRTMTDPTFILPIRRTIARTTETSVVVVVPEGASRVEVLYASTESLTSADFRLLIDDEVPETTVQMLRKTDYNVAIAGFKHTYWFTFSSQLIREKHRIFVAREGITSSRGTFTVQTVLPSNQEVYKAHVFFSSQNQTVDFNEENGKPFAIFTKVTSTKDNSDPISGMTVVAEVVNLRRPADPPIILALYDDGNIPDVLDRDGIYSAYFTPSEDGDYAFTLRYQFSSRSRSDNSLATFSKNLLPVSPETDEEFCPFFNNCPLPSVPQSYMHTAAEAEVITFKNVMSVSETPAKTNLMLFPSGANILLAWISPRVPSRSLNAAGTAFELRQSTRRNELLTNFDNCSMVVGNIPVPSPTGSLKFLSVRRPNETTYYAVRTVRNGFKSELSNIKEIQVVQEPTTTTTTTTTTSTTTTTTTPTTTTMTTITTPTTTTTSGTTTTTTTTSQNPSNPTEGEATTMTDSSVPNESEATTRITVVTTEATIKPTTEVKPTASTPEQIPTTPSSAIKVSGEIVACALLMLIMRICV